MTPESAEKKLAIESYMDGFQSIANIVVFTAMPGVILPPYLLKPHIAVLSLSWDFKHPVLNFHDDCIEVILSFNQRGYLCVVPWEAIIGVSRGDGSDAKQWQISEATEPSADESNTKILILPRENIDRNRAVRNLHMLMMQVGALDETDIVRFELAPLERSAYTGLKGIQGGKQAITYDLTPTPIPDPDPSVA